MKPWSFDNQAISMDPAWVSMDRCCSPAASDQSPGIKGSEYNNLSPEVLDGTTLTKPEKAILSDLFPKDLMLIQNLAAVLAAGIFLSAPVLANGQEPMKEKVKRAMSAAPAMISQKALILDMDGTVLRKGSNGWTCYPGVPLIPGSQDPMCNDSVWQAWITAASKGEDFKTDVIGFSYMLAGDGLVNNDNPAATDQTKGNWIKEGPHLMVLLPKSAIGSIPSTPATSGPYVMWGATPMFHLMVPVADRPEGALVIHNH